MPACGPALMDGPAALAALTASATTAIVDESSRIARRARGQSFMPPPSGDGNCRITGFPGSAPLSPRRRPNLGPPQARPQCEERVQLPHLEQPAAEEIHEDRRA